MSEPVGVEAFERSPAGGRQLELILEQVDRLPTLSPVALRLLSLGSAEEVDLAEVTSLIESDPSLTATVLGLCRRADRGLGDRVDSVRRALVLLGFDAVRSAVLSVHVYELLRERGEEQDRLGRTPHPALAAEAGEPLFDRVGLWKHCVAVACCAELLAEEHPELGVAPEAAFTAGVLHALGKLVLELVLPRATGRVVRLCERQGLDSAGVERRVIGLDHHVAGRRVAARWGLPGAIQDVIWLHGQPASGFAELEHGRLVGLIALAKAVCRRQHLGWSGDFGEPPSIRAVGEAVGVRAEEAERLVPRVISATVERCRVLELGDQTEPEVLLRSVACANERLSRMNIQLQTAAERGHRQRRVLEAIGVFHEHWRPGRTVLETLEQVARSAEVLLGRGYFAAVYQAGTGSPWDVHQFGAGGRLLRSQATEPPPGTRLRGESLASLTSSGGLSVAAMGVLPWLVDYLGDAPDLRRVRMLPITARDSAAGPWAVLIHDRDSAAGVLDERELDAARAVWAAGIQAAAESSQARALGERLADAGRRVAEMQARLTERESMAKLGEMSAGAAHEMNNPLTVIRGRAAMLASALKDGELGADAAAVAEAAAHLSELITGMHVLAEPAPLSFSRTGVAGLLEEAAAVGRGLAGGGGRAVVEATARSGAIEADGARLAQALGEVIANAIEADPGGVVEIAAHLDESDGRLVVTVADRGRGLSARALRHAFDPFFSDRAAGRRTGLGLPRARRVIELHGGEITLVNREGGGAVATVSLPVGQAVSGPEGAGVAVGLPAGSRAAA